MAPALFTTGQSRWALQILVSLLSAVAIASSAPSAVGGSEMYAGNPGDIRGINVVLGATSLGGILISTAWIFLPKPWRIYVDRLEFAFVSMLWICWTSATMAFSAFTLDIGVCSSIAYKVPLPTCPILTFDLALLHLLSTVTLALLLVILTTALSPHYYISHSSLLSQEGGEETGLGKGADPENDNVFVMWDLAIASPPTSPRLSPNTPITARSYGTAQPATPISSASFGRPSNPYAASVDHPTEPGEAVAIPPRTRDKFADGRVGSYVSLALCSVGVIVGTGLIIGQGEFVASSVIIIVVAALSLSFAVTFLVIHLLHKRGKVAEEGFIRRHGKALEVGLAGILFLMWPLAAIVYTLFPSSPFRPCSNPDPSSPLDFPPLSSLVCPLSSSVIALAWLASWIILARVMGLIFPMPEMGALKAVVTATQGEEERSLLGSESGGQVVRPQVGYGRIMAGEAFELGDEEEDL